MQTEIKNLHTRKYVLISLLSVGFIVVFANFLGEDIAKITSSMLYIPIPGALVVFSVIIAKRFGKIGKHGYAWMSFIGLAVSWFIAEQIWLVEEIAYNNDPFPSLADVFYFAGYPFLMIFSIYYLKPVRKAISKSIFCFAVIASTILSIPAIYIAYTNYNENALETALSTLYPVVDTIVMIPALIGLLLFFKGEVNFLWSLACLAILCNVVGDTGFQIMSLNESYYTGSILEIPYLWAYLFFTFGVYSHIQIYKKQQYEKTLKWDLLDEFRPVNRTKFTKNL